MPILLKVRPFAKIKHILIHKAQVSNLKRIEITHIKVGDYLGRGSGPMEGRKEKEMGVKYD
jgi:hypothetical protein